MRQRTFSVLSSWAVAEAESEKSSAVALPRSSPRDPELEPLRDEMHKARHHPLSCSFAANVDIKVVRISNEAVPALLEHTVNFV
jgi:hypothetical protein